ncbi:hypothetical protein DINM_003456 [Dirofilaria immitis]|nr:hypothetical protein [Dirofilaria immitis]
MLYGCRLRLRLLYHCGSSIRTGVAGDRFRQYGSVLRYWGCVVEGDGAAGLDDVCFGKIGVVSAIAGRGAPAATAPFYTDSHEASTGSPTLTKWRRGIRLMRPISLSRCASSAKWAWRLVQARDDFLHWWVDGINAFSKYVFDFFGNQYE